MAEVDPVQRVASKQGEWQALSVEKKIVLLQEIKGILEQLTTDTIVEMFGNAEADMMGFAVNSIEGKFEATQASFMYVVVITDCVSKLLDAYQYHVGTKKLPELKTFSPTSGRTAVQTLPVLASDKFGMLAKCQAEVWLEEGASFEPMRMFKDSMQNASSDGCTVVLGAGNHCFLSMVDVLFSLFHRNSVVYLKHHPIRSHHDPVLRHILQPLIRYGYFDSELDSGTLERSKDIVYHKAVSNVHLTGGKATHDTIVWGGPQRKKPILQARMTSELGCVTPWMVAPQEWTEQQLDHQVKSLFASMFSNAGANCNSPKVVLLTKDWPHRQKFVQKLCEEMETNVMPVAYYPGSKERWMSFRKAYPKALELGDNSPKASADRQLKATATLLPWLVIDGIQVNLTTDEGRKAAASEYAFRNEPFAPIVTIAYVDDLDAAVTLSNEYVLGSLSCTLVAPNTTTPDVEKAIANLRYGGIAVNTWSAICYFATGCTWGAFPGDRLENVQSGIGQIRNCFFIPAIEKSILRTPMIDVSHPLRKSNLEAARKEFKAIADFALKPGVYRFVNLITSSTMGVEVPPPLTLLGIAVAVVGFATWKLWMPVSAES